MNQFIKNRIANLVLAILVLGIVTGAVSPEKTYAAPAATAAVGVVDFGLLVTQHPDTPKANESIKAEAEAADKEFAAKTVSLGDKEKEDLRVQLLQRVEQKRQAFLKVIADKINATVREVAAAKGLTIVVPKGIVVYGGVDITDEVLKKLR